MGIVVTIPLMPWIATISAVALVMVAWMVSGRARKSIEGILIGDVTDTGAAGLTRQYACVDDPGGILTRTDL